MIQITNLNEVNKFVGRQLALQSGLTVDNVYNALSLHGTALRKRIEDTQIFTSYDVSDCVLLFELESDNNSDGASMSLDDEKIIFDKTYKISITIYGNASEDVANTTIARLRTEKVRTDIQNNGFTILSVSNSTTINEFVNETIWHRSDFSIKISCEIVIEPVEKENKFDSTDFEIIIK